MDEMYDKIDLYILGRMSDDEKSVFEREMAADPELASEVEQRRLLMIGMRAQEAEDLYWEEQTERIDSYLLQEMSDEEVAEFEKQLKWDTELRSHLETQRLIMTGIRLDAAQKSIDEIEEEYRVAADPVMDEYKACLSDGFYEDEDADYEEAYEPVRAESRRIPLEKPQISMEAIKVSHRRRNFIRLFNTFAVAACLCLVVMTTGHFVGKSYGSDAFDYAYRSPDEVAELVEAKQYEQAIELLNGRIETMGTASKDNPSLREDIVKAKYELASVYLKDGDISKAKSILKSMEDLFHARVLTPNVEKAKELYDKHWWILW